MEYRLESLIHHSKVMQQIDKELRPFIDSAAPLLFWGERRSGIGFYARTIHAVSSRYGKFVAIPAFSIDEDTVKQQFFGNGDEPGWLEEAHQGTIFLKRLQEVPLKAQHVLFQLIDNQGSDGRIQFSRKGRTNSQEVNVRFIFSLTHDLNTAIQDGLLAHDLIDELKKSGKIVRMPPLRERREDIIGIAQNFFEDFNQQFQQNITGIDTQAQQILTDYNWPGNIDELKRTIESIFAHAAGISEITAEQLPEHIQKPAVTGDKYSFKLKNDIRFVGKILMPVFLQFETEHQKHRLNIENIVEILRVEDTKFAPPKFKHFAVKLNDGSCLTGKIKDPKLLVSASFDPNYEVQTQDIYSIIPA